MLGLSVLPAVLQFLGFIFLPESPRWLLQKGQNQEALQVLRWIRGDQNVEEEYDSIKANIEEEEKEVGAGKDKAGNCKLEVLFIAGFVLFLKRFCFDGQVALFFFACSATVQLAEL